MAVTTDIATYLQTQGIGTIGTNIFIGELPPKPDTCCSVFTYGANPPSLVWNGEFPDVQVRVRGETHDLALAKAYAVMKALHKKTEITVNSHLYHFIGAKHSPTSLGREAGRARWLYVVNFTVEREME